MAVPTEGIMAKVALRMKTDVHVSQERIVRSNRGRLESRVNQENRGKTARSNQESRGKRENQERLENRGSKGNLGNRERTVRQEEKTVLNSPDSRGKTDLSNHGRKVEAAIARKDAAERNAITIAKNVVTARNVAIVKIVVIVKTEDAITVIVTIAVPMPEMPQEMAETMVAITMVA